MLANMHPVSEVRVASKGARAQEAFFNQLQPAFSAFGAAYLRDRAVCMVA